jgi:hypothetical protein
MQPAVSGVSVWQARFLHHKQSSFMRSQGRKRLKKIKGNLEEGVPVTIWCPLGKDTCAPAKETSAKLENGMNGNEK